MRASLLGLTILALCAVPAVSIMADEEINSGIVLPSVQILALDDEGHGGIGTGVIFSAQGRQFVLTAGHVVSSLREEHTSLDEKSGSQRTEVVWHDVKIVQQIMEDGKKAGEIQLLAHVVEYSKLDQDGGEDLALLEVDSKRQLVSAKFVPAGMFADQGVDCWHLGSMMGDFSFSLTKGIISHTSRKLYNKTFMQTDTAVAPGSSGGGVFIKADDATPETPVKPTAPIQHKPGFVYVGMLTRGSNSAAIGFCIPATRIRAWLKSVRYEFVIGE